MPGEAGQRAGFWRRVLAAVIDFLITVLLLQALAAVAFPLTGGRVQDSNGIPSTCYKQDRLLPGVVLPQGFVPTFAVQCAHTLFGIPVGRTFVAGRTEQDGTVTKTLSFTTMLTPDGQVMAFDLASLLFVLPILFRYAFDVLWQATPGRRLMRIRLVDRSGVRGPGFAMRACRRYALFLLPSVPFMLGDYLGFGIGVAAFTLPFREFIGLLTIELVPGLVANLAAAIAIVRRRDAYYDRWSGTAVLRKVGQGGFTSDAGTPEPLR